MSRRRLALRRSLAALSLLATLQGCASALLLGGGEVARPPMLPAGGRAGADPALTTRVNAALLREPRLGARDIRVATYNGVVQLRGRVTGPGQRQLAGRIAAGVSGVHRVDNRIEIDSGGAD